jgi:hypothetical protein
VFWREGAKGTKIQKEEVRRGITVRQKSERNKREKGGVKRNETGKRNEERG